MSDEWKSGASETSPSEFPARLNEDMPSIYFDGAVAVEPSGPQLVTAVFCRDIIQDRDTGEISAWKMIQTFDPQPDFSEEDRELHMQEDLWFLTIFSNVPDHSEELLAEGPLPEYARFEMDARTPSGKEIFHARVALSGEGPLGWSASQLSFSIPIHDAGVLTVDVSYGGKHLTRTALDIREYVPRSVRESHQ